MERRAEHTFATTPGRLWEVFLLDRAFLDWAYPQMGLELVSCEIEQTGEGETLCVTRTLELLPQREMPGFLKRLVKGSSKVMQAERFDAVKGEMSFTVSIPVIGDRVSYGGHYTWEEQADSCTLRRWRGFCEARIPLVGRKVEAFFLDELESGVEAMAPLLNEWLATHPAS